MRSSQVANSTQRLPLGGGCSTSVPRSNVSLLARGKRLGFLLQEMLREVNTTGSKAADAAMLADVVLLKEELERVREQVENVE